VFNAINASRRGAGLRVLTWNSGLQTSAQQHNQAMASSNTLSHQAPGEADLGKRESSAGVFWWWAGENIAMSSSLTAQAALDLESAMVNEQQLHDIFGKFLGNVVFLSSFVGGYMVVSMVMQLVRGEAPLEPLIFLKQYAIMTPATIVFVSVTAIVFESIPFLSGRFGDVHVARSIHRDSRGTDEAPWRFRVARCAAVWTRTPGGGDLALG